MCNFNFYNFIIATVSIFLAVIIAVLFYFGFIINIATIITVISIIAAVLLLIIIILLLVPFFSSRLLNRCLCKFAGAIIVGSIGTILASLLTIAFPVTIGSVVSAVIIFLCALFFLIALFAFALFLYCILYKKCGRKCNCTNTEEANNQGDRCNLSFMD